MNVEGLPPGSFPALCGSIYVFVYCANMWAYVYVAVRVFICFIYNNLLCAKHWTKCFTTQWSSFYF